MPMRMDLHCDTITMLQKHETLERSHCKVSLENLKTSRTLVQCFAIFIPTGYFPGPFRDFLVEKQVNRIYGNFLRMLETYPQEIVPVRSFSDVERCRQQGGVGALLTLEDGGILGKDLLRVEKFYRMGVRLVTLTWNSVNPIGYPQSRKPKEMQKGLKPFGFEVVEELERLGIAVDVSHLSDGGFWDVIRHGKKPPLASHSCARALRNHPRNLTDEMIRALAEKGGIVGINFCPAFLAEYRDNRVEDIVRHMCHIYRVGGEDVLALGSDFDGIGGKNEVADPADCEKLLEPLRKAGFSERMLEKIWHGNAETYFREVLG